MKRAPFKAYVRKGDHDLWYCLTLTHYGTEVRQVSAPLPTHQEALDAALVAVGLAKPAEHREAP